MVIEIEQPRNSHLKQHEWVPGQSGNPKGRPKNTLTSLLEKHLNENGEVEKQALIEELVKLAKTSQGRGQIPALKEIFERMDGKVADKSISIVIQATPETIQAAQDQMRLAQGETAKLLDEYPG